MKRVNLLIYLAGWMILLGIISCKKEVPVPGFGTNIGSNNPPPPPPPPPPPVNSAPRASAGSDQMVFLPANSCILAGWYSNNINTLAWEKISGPNSSLIEYPTLLSTQIKNLVQGVYQFTLKVTDLYGLFTVDTVTITVGQIPDSPSLEIINNVNWGTVGFNGTLLWGSAIIIPNIYQHVPTGRVFKIFIRKGNSIIWEELFIGDNALYSVVILKGTLGIWSGVDETEAVSIKLVY